WTWLLNRNEARLIASGDGIPGWQAGPAWSQSGEFLALSAGGELYKARVRDGAITPLCQIPDGAGEGPFFSGASWSADDNFIVFAVQDRIWEVPAGGGKPVVVIAPEAGKGISLNTTPHFLPAEGGKRLLLYAANP